MSDEINLEDSLAEDTQHLTFYNGTEELYYDKRLHIRYRIVDGEKQLVAGATTVTDCIDKSGPLTQWAANQTIEHLRGQILPDTAYSALQLETAYYDARFNYRKTSRTALDIGNLAHEWLDKYQQWMLAGNTGVYSEPLPEDEKAANCVKAAVEWMAKHNFEPYCVERQVYSRVHNFCGTYDHLAWITACGDPKCCPFEGRIFVLGDFKSSKRLYEEYRLQTACYKCAHEEEFPDLPIDARLVIRLDKEGDGIETMTLLQDSYEADLEGFLGTLELYKWGKQLDYDKKYEKQVKKHVDGLEKASRKLLESLKPKSSKKPVVIKELGAGIPVEV